MSERETPPRELIISIFGLYARAEQNWLSVAAIVRLMADLGADGQSVRAAVHRLKRSGVLIGRKIETVAGYELSDLALQSFAEGDARIFGRRRATLVDGWLLLVFSFPETERDRRHELRTELNRLDFGTAAPGAWIAPGNLYDETRQMLERHGLTEYVDIVRGDYLAFGDVATRVQNWWNFEELTKSYREFLATYQGLRAKWRRGTHSDADAFKDYIHTLTTWRRIADPRLAPEVLPRNWVGLQGGALFDELNELLKVRAETHARAAIHRWGVNSLPRRITAQ